MVDVTLVILIFFMASAAFIGPEWALRLGLAPADGTARAPTGALPGAQFTVRMIAEGDAIRYEGLGVTATDPRAMAAAADRVARGAPGSMFVLAPDAAIAYQSVLDAHAAFIAVGLDVRVQP